MLNNSDGNLSARGDIETILVDENLSKELINDIICDNIILKNRLESVVMETTSLKKNLDEIGNRVKEINDVCDMLVSEKLRTKGKHGTNIHSNESKCKSTMLYP